MQTLNKSRSNSVWGRRGTSICCHFYLCAIQIFFGERSINSVWRKDSSSTSFQSFPTFVQPDGNNSSLILKCLLEIIVNCEKTNYKNKFFRIILYIFSVKIIFYLQVNDAATTQSSKSETARQF
jgi:hypothetical protein